MSLYDTSYMHKTAFEDVATFHIEVLSEHAPMCPENLPFSRVRERYAFMKEELQEFFDAAVEGDLTGQADALADLMYVVLGTAYQLGIPFNKVWEFVHEANMKKVRGRTHRGFEIDAAKPEGWEDPKIRIAALINLKRRDHV